MTKKHRSHFNWTWYLFVLFFVLSLIDYRFGILGFLCMALPIIQVFRGKGRVHCSSHCPRGAFLNNILKAFHFNMRAPKLFRNNKFKWALFALIMAAFVSSMYLSKGDPSKIGFAVFRMVVITTIAALAMGILHKPRMWCTICPMGHLSSAVAKNIKK